MCRFFLNRTLLIAVAGLALSGCQTTSRLQLAAISDFESCDPSGAMASLDEAASTRGAEAELISIDRAILSLMDGDTAECERRLSAARQQLEFLQQQDLAEQTRAVFTDEHAVSWTGREYEQRMIDNLLVLSSLLGDRQDAVAYTNQVMSKVYSEQEQVSEKAVDVPTDESPAGHAFEPDEGGEATAPPTRLKTNAFASYLQAAVNSESTMNSDVTDRAIRQVGFWMGHDTNAADNSGGQILTARMGAQTDKGYGTLHVITFAGRVTDWVEEVAAPTSAALLLADQILSAAGDHTLPPTVAPVRIARPRYNAGRHRSTVLLRQMNNGQPTEAIRSRTVVDLNSVAWDSWQEGRDRTIARAVARRIVKKGAVYAAKDQLSINSDTGIDVLLNVGGMAWEAMEKPDKRHVTLLPERIELAQLELPAGSHRVSLQPVPRDMNSVPENVTGQQIIDVHIENGLNTFVLCFQPADRLHVVPSSGVAYVTATSQD